jgi:signal transduction histidine kinase
MLKKIGVKLLLSYLVLLIVAFSISSITYNFLSERYVINETRKQLNSEGQEIARLLTNVPISSNSIKGKLAGKTIIRAAERFIEADIIILNNERDVIYRSIENLDKKIVLKLIRAGNSAPAGYVAARTVIIDKNGVTKGHVVLYAKLNNIYELNKLMRGTELISMLVAGVVALVISLLFGKSLVGPIMALTKKIDQYSATKQLDSNTIQTGDEIQQLDECFIAMTKSIQKYNDSQQKFLQNTSHELKTPLMSIQGYAEAIKDGIIKEEEMNEALEVIIEQSQRLKGIVEELIYLTRMENSEEKLNLECTNLKELVYSVCQSIKLMAEEKQVIIEIEINSQINIFCDRDKLHRALLNLLSNGIRYANNNININAAIESKQVRILIQDDGDGFETNEENKVFDRFYKGERGSTGLGLSIVKAIVEAHDGSIRAYNAMAKGAIFEIHLPIN